MSATITNAGNYNPTAGGAPRFVVNIVLPAQLLVGVPSNILGIVGSATWGEVNTAVIVGSPQDYTSKFGLYTTRIFDMGTQVVIAALQGAASFKCVRVTDSTDLAANGSIQGGAALAVAKYTGTYGNGIRVGIAAGSKVGTWRAVVYPPGQQAELFDNIATGSTPAVTWANIVAAVNTGAGTTRAASQFITLAIGTPVAPVASVYPMSGGTDGADNINAAQLLGNDSVTPATGLYALRRQGCSVAMIADLTDVTTFAAQAAFSLSEGCYMVGSTPAGDTPTSAVATFQAEPYVDDPGFKKMLGDFLLWQDTLNQVTRFVSPQAFIAGRLANLSPEQSSLNKPVQGVIGSQRSGEVGSGTTATYSSAELDALALNDFDVIAVPSFGGNYWGAQTGLNSSSNPTISGDNYTRLTYYLAKTFARGLGSAVGQTITTQLMRDEQSEAQSFIDAMVNATPPQLEAGVAVCGPSNNPPDQIALGFLQLDVQARYLGIVYYFTVNLQGGQTVTVTAQPAVGG